MTGQSRELGAESRAPLPPLGSRGQPSASDFLHRLSLQTARVWVSFLLLSQFWQLKKNGNKNMPTSQGCYYILDLKYI